MQDTEDDLSIRTPRSCHPDVFREVGELKGLIMSLNRTVLTEIEDKRQILERLGKLETRMAQVVMVAVCVSVFVPPLLTYVVNHVQFVESSARERR